MSLVQDSGGAGDLSVNFPRQERLARGVHKSPRTVHLYPTSLLYLFAYPDPEDRNNRSYSKEDQVRFKMELLRDKRKMMWILATTPSGNISPEELYESIGMENILTDTVIARVIKHKQRHIRKILSEKSRQRMSGNVICNEDMCRVSEESSRWAQLRAHNIALHYGTS